LVEGNIWERENFETLDAKVGGAFEGFDPRLVLG
jgi:hypothetical protein